MVFAYLQRKKADRMANLFRDETVKSVQKAKRRDDFVAVLQPILSEGVIPSIEYLSDLDCFHPSAFGQRALAISVWNCMLLPASQKPTAWEPSMLFPICPDDSSLIRTD